MPALLIAVATSERLAPSLMVMLVELAEPAVKVPLLIVPKLKVSVPPFMVALVDWLLVASTCDVASCVTSSV
jgi:hypothetical protein